MAVFQHNSRNIKYRIEAAPFGHDLVLLQGSRYTVDLWRPLLEDFANLPEGEGRILVCDWSDSQRNVEALAADFMQLLRALGMRSSDVVAVEDAVGMVEKLREQTPGLLEKTLLWPGGAPNGDEMKRLIRAFCLN